MTIFDAAVPTSPHQHMRNNILLHLLVFGSAWQASSVYYYRYLRCENRLYTQPHASSPGVGLGVGAALGVAEGIGVGAGQATNRHGR